MLEKTRLSALAIAFAFSLFQFEAAPRGGAPASASANTGLSWRPTPAQIATSCDADLSKAQKNVKAALVRKDAAPFDRLLEVENAEATLADGTAVQTVLYQISPDKRVRDASQSCNQRVSNFQVALAADPGIYALARRVAADGSAPSEADRKLVELYVEGGRRSGAGLSPGRTAEVTKLFQRLNDLQRDFGVNLSNDSSAIEISRGDAASLPASFVAGLKTTSKGFIVPVNESTYEQFMRNERAGEARKRFAVTFFRRGGEKNVELLQQAIALRDRLAHLLGFSNWAAYQLDGKMAKSPARVTSFLRTIDATLLPKARTEVAELAKLRADAGEAGAFALWDYAYFENRLEKERYSVDAREVRKYFPVDHVVASVLDIYQRLLGVTFAELTPADAWAPGVREFSISEAENGELIGWFYLDLFPRPGKYAHFAEFPLRLGRELPDGTYQKPVASVIGNWPVGEPGRPALLSHDEVLTFFHEFGHVMHATLCTSPYETTDSMVGVRQDFIEAPSQMLENWMWQPQILKRVSHNVATGAPLPDALIARMVALKHVGDGVHWTNQAFLGLYDMTIHSSGPKVDTTAQWANLARATTVFRIVPGTIPQAGFGHLMGGYDAGYYGYMWSKVYAQDMFSRFQRGGLLSPVVGREYRRDILEPGAIEEPDELVQRFLGRPVGYDAFYRDLGITK